jgi:hypothetical protein
LQHRIKQSLGRAGIATGRRAGRNDFPLSRNAGLSIRDVPFGKDVVLVFAFMGHGDEASGTFLPHLKSRGASLKVPQIQRHFAG